MIFLWNAAIIGLIGGIIGIMLGAFLSYLLPNLLGSSLPMTRGGVLTVVSAKSLLMAVGISCGVGIIAGLVPAYQASKLKPVDALRFE
jgi:putative ABC transport system permease protein